MTTYRPTTTADILREMELAHLENALLTDVQLAAAKLGLIWADAAELVVIDLFDRGVRDVETVLAAARWHCEVPAFAAYPTAA